MTRRAWAWVAALALADAVAFAVTVHSQATYHPAAGSPSVTTAGRVLGWAISVILLIVVVLTVLGARQAARYRRLRDAVESERQTLDEK
jgi:uncharacterized membrane protein